MHRPGFPALTLRPATLPVASAAAAFALCLGSLAAPATSSASPEPASGGHASGAGATGSSVAAARPAPTVSAPGSSIAPAASGTLAAARASRVPSAQPSAAEIRAIAKGQRYRTQRTTPLFAAARGAARIDTLPPRYVVAAERKAAKGSKRVKVHYLGRTGWLELGSVRAVAGSTRLGASHDSYTASAYAGALRRQVSAYCPGVSIKVTSNRAGSGEYYATNIPLQIVINRYDDPDPRQPSMRAIVLHECGHILQYRAYGVQKEATAVSGYAKLDAATGRLFKGGDPVELSADCMADAMGAKRKGTDFTGQGYQVGYGKGCNAKQRAAAAKLVKGKRL